MTVKVSICVPNLNTRGFLPERFQSIFEQTFDDWELLVYDSYSDDGAWEYIQALAAEEPRMRAWQGPREGTPGSWTPCVRQARGEYVYIATSDDTMAVDCLARMVAALDAHPECDIAHCPLLPIDGHGQEVRDVSEWWLQHSMFALSSGALLDRPHVRHAPFDGALHLLGASVYISITQLLIRRSLFDRIGAFARTWGSVGDFNWSMRAGLAANTVHVPGTWGGWRLHADQATAAVAFNSPEHVRKVEAMVADALAACLPLISEPLRPNVAALARDAVELRAFMREVARGAGRPAARRYAFLARRLLGGSLPAREYARERLLRRPPADWVRRCLDAEGTQPWLLPAEAVASPRAASTCTC